MPFSCEVSIWPCLPMINSQENCHNYNDLKKASRHCINAITCHYQGNKLNCILTLLKRTEIDKRALKLSSSTTDFEIVRLPVVDPQGNYSHGYIGAMGK